MRAGGVRGHPSRCWECRLRIPLAVLVHKVGAFHDIPLPLPKGLSQSESPKIGGMSRRVTPCRFCWWLSLQRHCFGDSVTVLVTTFRPISPYLGHALSLVLPGCWWPILKRCVDGGDVVKRDTLDRFIFLISRVWKLNGAEQWRESNSLEDRIPPTYGPCREVSIRNYWMQLQPIG